MRIQLSTLLIFSATALCMDPQYGTEMADLGMGIENRQRSSGLLPLPLPPLLSTTQAIRTESKNQEQEQAREVVLGNTRLVKIIASYLPNRDLLNFAQINSIAAQTAEQLKTRFRISINQLEFDKRFSRDATSYYGKIARLQRAQANPDTTQEISFPYRCATQLTIVPHVQFGGYSPMLRAWRSFKMPLSFKHIKLITEQFPRLQYLDVKGNLLENELAATKLGQLPELSRLRITLNSGDFFKILAASPLAKTLTGLNLEGSELENSFTAETINNFENLTELDLRAVSTTTNNMLLTLSNSKVAAQLLGLLLGESETNLDNFNNQTLNKFKALRKLCLSGQGVHEEFFEVIAQSDCARKLETLQFIAGTITNYFCHANINRFKALKVLIIEGIGDKGFTELANSRIAKTLISLNIVLADMTAKSFSTDSLDKFIHLEELYITGQFGAQALKALAESVIMKKLKKVLVDDSDTPLHTYATIKAAFEELQERYPQVNIQRGMHSIF